MAIFKRRRPVYRQKRFIIPVILVLLLVTLRVVAPPLIRSAMNSYLEDFSPSLHLEVGAIDMSLVRASYSASNIRGQIKQSGQQFVEVGEVAVSLPWREVLRGNIVANVMMSQMDFTYSDDLMPAIQEHLAYMEREDPEPPPVAVKVNRFDLKESRIRLAGYPRLTKDEDVAVTQLEGRVTNLIPDDSHTRTLFNFDGNVLKSGRFKSVGELDLTSEPPRWRVDGELQGFNLVEVNRFLRHNVPVTFDSGVVDVYAEAIGSGGNYAKGYIKPFMENVRVLGSPDDFKNIQHWAFDVLTAAATRLVREGQTDTVATEIPFEYDGEMQIEITEVILNALQHGHQQRLTRGIESRYELQAQEDREAKDEK
jgi:hypothetical protein